MLIIRHFYTNAITQKLKHKKMKNTIEQQNEEALLNAFKIEELEERLETLSWTGGCNGLTCPMNS
jgi:hypothetical protein